VDVADVSPEVRTVQPPARPRLSVLIVTYNHEAYIGRAIEGLLQQRLPAVGVEVVVADDHSEDGTVTLAHALLDSAPGLQVRFLPSRSNLGVTRNYQRGFAACEGDYVAVLEGDDYWTSPEKLRRQISFLNAHRECQACACNYFIRDEANGTFELRLKRIDGYSFVDSRQIILDNLPGNFSSLMYRRSALQALPEGLFALRAYDWLVNICVARSGPIGVLHQPMSVYRVHERGTWSRLSSREKLLQQLTDIRTYDKFTNGVFHDQFDACARNLSLRYPPRGGTGPRLMAVLRALLPPVLLQCASLLVPPVIPILYRTLRDTLRND
jgi:glycosyltransferase involved in cell wall biosynthesis